MEKKWNWIKWKKMDLHLHTKKTKRDNANFISINKSNVDDFVDKIVENNVKLIAITNHNEVDLAQYKLIKEKANKKNLEVILGVEINGEWKTKNNINKPFQFNLLMEDEFLEKNCQNINNELKNLNTKQKEGFLKKALNEDEIIKLINSLEGRIILCLDYGKSSSNVTKTDFKNQFWFYFDIFEGNNRIVARQVHNNLKKLLEKQNINQISCPPIIYGTDNRNYMNYPNNDSRKGWTGSFFLCEPSFNGLLSAIDFHFLVKTKNNMENLNDEPELNAIELSYFDFIHHKDQEKNKNKIRIFLDRGVNVILGRRGSGKSVLLKKISDELEAKNVDFFKLEQNQVTNIIEKGFKNNAIFENEVGEKVEYEKIFLNFKKNIYKNSYIENFSFQEINIETLYRKIFDLIKADKENTQITKQDGIINNLNEYFSLFNSNGRVLQDINTINNFFLENQKNVVLKNILKFLDFHNFKIEMNELLKTELKSININFQANNLIKKNTLIIKNEMEKWLLELEKILENREKAFTFIIKELEKIFEKLKEKYFYKSADSKVLSFEFNMLFLKEVKIYIDEIGKYNKKRNLFNNLQEIYKKPFWNKEQIEYSIKRKNYHNEESDFKIIKKMNDKDVSTLSPGQMVEEYIKNIFESNAYKVFLIDQPEDQLDAITISKTIIQPIQKRYDDFLKKGVQLIFVTHDPKIAINLGALNIIECEEKSNSVYSKTNLYFSEIYEKEKNFIDKVDGKKDYVHKRSQIYGKRN